ncbi:glycosyltransferase family 50 protein [Phlebiopsis gigantea 11061_1 CR5-6]|uniref:GPI mannosyltransferase 1 n=1 Tax=Phlebiopsis gigantea (strain 11061_1 CR5-6) TaxID=745531 RepID=A0A0C3SFL7_PHLG1|nr:glycosyltransferase family 50 protein [Phlebiopsis gigantea 11061_1 CR5-6]
MTHYLDARNVPSFKTVLQVAIALRVCLILFSDLHDAYSVVKYTDVDYRVFSDAARFVLHPSDGNTAQGPVGKHLGLGETWRSPYTRATYRYTPLLALLLAPNEFLHPSFGKYLFAACDIVAGVLIHNLLVDFIIPSSKSATAEPADDAPKPGPPADDAAAPPRDLTETKATLLATVHLLNPLVFTISTRGSSEAVLALFVLLALHAARGARWAVAGAWLGLAAHWKIYPFVYGVACACVLAREAGGGGGLLRGLCSWRVARFVAASAGTFAVLGGAMYAIWGEPFLRESYLYHLHRLDHRHNFSPYFYLIYLTYPTHYADDGPLPLWRAALRSPLTSFVPQMALSLGAGVLFGRRRGDLAFAWFVQTFAFVLFNRVCTSQYFLWYTLFLPLLMPQLRLSAREAVQLCALWIGTQALWLSEAYKLEFLGENVFYGLWARGVIYLCGHARVLAGIMQSYQG